MIDVIIGWLDRSFIGSSLTSPHAVDLLPFATNLTVDLAASDPRLTGLLQAYGYLVATISYLGAEQALCSVFHSFVCFSHRETFYYANFSFAGEAVFRLYRHSYPFDGREPRRQGWRTDEHSVFFPELSDCRQEIIADLDYIGLSTDPSLCSAVRKNETRFYELDQLTVDEVERLVDDIRRRLDSTVVAARLRYMVSGLVAVSAIVYTVLATVTHCLTQSRCRPGKHCCAADSRKRKQSAHLLEAASTTIYSERPLDRTATAADNSCLQAADVELALSNEFTTTSPSRTLTGSLPPNDVSPHTPTADCNHRRQLSPPPPPNFSALKVACV